VRLTAHLVKAVFPKSFTIMANFLSSYCSRSGFFWKSQSGFPGAWKDSTAKAKAICSGEAFGSNLK